MNAPARPIPEHRVDWVDYAKGFCIVLVVMMHATLGVEKAAGETGWLGLFVEFARPFRMPDFFLISGLFLGLVITRPWGRYFDRKVVHFLYFYVLWLTIQFAFKAPGWIADGDSISEVAGRYLFSFVQPFGTLWFIYMLPVFFIVTRLARNLPWWLLLGGAALLEILPVHTGWLMIDEFAARYVYFLGGYLLAGRIFGFARWAGEHVWQSAALLAVWAVVNGLVVFAPVGEALAGLAGVASHADLPVVSLLLGSAGAMAIVLAASLLSKLRGAGFLAWLGSHSIVVYLAFFLPMAISRAVLLKFAPFLDIGTVSALVTLASVAGPVMLYWFIQWSGQGRFLFHRPAWAWTDPQKRGKPGNTRAGLHPAE